MTESLEHYQGVAQNLIESLGYEQALYVANQYAWCGLAEEVHRFSGGDGHVAH